MRRRVIGSCAIHGTNFFVSDLEVGGFREVASQKVAGRGSRREGDRRKLEGKLPIDSKAKEKEQMTTIGTLPSESICCFARSQFKKETS